MRHKPTRLHSKMSVQELRAYYRLMSELTSFARQLGLSAHGDKPTLLRRIERRLRGLPDRPESEHAAVAGVRRDSAKQLRRSTPVVNYKSDDKTRAFFRSAIGEHFHFTYHLNQYRLKRRGLTYGDLIDEWVREHARRRRPGYKAPIASHGEYNRYIRDFFADPRNAGKPFAAAVAGWNTIKHVRGDRRYKRAISRSGPSTASRAGSARR